MPAEDFFQGVYLTAVEPGEVLTRVTFPPPAVGEGAGFGSMTIGKEGTGIVNVAARVCVNGTIAEPRVVVGCVAAVPFARRRWKRLSRDRCRPRRTFAWPPRGSARARPALRCPCVGRLPVPPGGGHGGAGDAGRDRGGDPLTPEPQSERRVSVELNGDTYELTVESRRLLVHFIRDDCGLTGTHVGCDTGNCGACTVILDGMAVKSCMLLAVQADGATIETVESLAGEDGGTSSAAARVLRAPRAPVRLLHARDADEREAAARAEPEPDGARRAPRDPGKHLPLHGYAGIVEAVLAISRGELSA